MDALTLWRPWPDAIFSWPGKHAKRLENRGWWRQSTVGKTIAIHAGKKYDPDGAEMISELAVAAGVTNGGWTVPGPSASPEGVIGVVTVCAIVDAGRYDADVCVIAGAVPVDMFIWREWWMGGIAWVLADVRRLAVPVPCRGAQGLWPLPEDVERQVLAQLSQQQLDTARLLGAT